MKKNLLKSIVLSLVCLCFSINKVNACGGGGSSDPRFGNIRFGSKNTPTDGTNITWGNKTNSTDKIKWGYSTSYEKGEFSGSKYENYDEGSLFDYEFPELKPDATIHYQLFNSNNNTWTGDKVFKTSTPTTSAKFSFIAMGDSRTHMDNWKSVANSVKKADFVLFTGDIVDNGNNSQDWEDWYESGTSVNEEMVFYHCYGNHDGSSSNYTRQFVLPGNEKYYSFNFGNAVFICLDSQNPGSSSQNDWLRKTLSDNSDKKWKIVFYHKPFYTCGGHAGEMDRYFNTWWKAFDDYGVDLIFNGHAHNYQRTNPINRNVSTGGPVSNYGSGSNQGRCQVVTGGAGAPLYGVSANSWYAKVQAVNHHCQIDVDGNSLRVRAIKTNGNLIDDFTLSKTLKNGNPYTSFEENKTIKEIEIFPNPATSSFTLKVTPSDKRSEALISIYALDGTLKRRLTIPKGSFKIENNIDVSDLSSGTYYVQVVWDNKLETGQLIVE